MVERWLQDFADQYLSPYVVKGDKILPKLCPICHGGNHRDVDTFILNINTGGWTCKRGSCGRHGNFNELAQLLGSKQRFMYNNIPQNRQYNLPTCEIHELTEQIKQYFAKRGISEGILKEYGVGSDENGNIVFPFYDGDVLTYVKYRKPGVPDKGRKEWQEPNTKQILFGMNKCDNSVPLIICEGQIDALSIAESGEVNVVSVPCGCDSLDWVENCWDWLEQFNDIILFGDNDAPGQRMVETLIRRLGEGRCSKVDVYPVTPDGKQCKDANDVLVNFDGFTVIEMIENAKKVPIKGLLNLASIHPVDPTTIPRIKTNIPALDEALGGLAEGAVTVFTGKSGKGKSTVGGLLLLNAVEAGYKTCAYSGELSKEEFQQWIHFQAAGSDYITLKHDPIKGKLVPYVQEDVQRRIMDWYDGKFFLFDNNEIFEVNQSESILNVFTTAANRYGCKLFLVDNLMTSLSDSDEETRAQGRFMALLKRFALRYHAHVIVVAHARKTQRGEKIGEDDISGNSATVKLAHSAIVVERPNLRIIKARDSGMTRFIQCCYCPDSRRIYQMNVGDRNYFSWDKTGIKEVNPKACSILEYQEQHGEGLNEPF